MVGAVVMGKPSRDKGKRREQQAAALVREWVGPEWDVSRNARNAQKGPHTAGDLCVERAGHWFPYCIEVKGHASFCPSLLWRPGGGFLFGKWASQALEQADSCGREALLMMKPDRRPWLVAAPFYESARFGLCMTVETECGPWLVTTWERFTECGRWSPPKEERWRR